MGSKQNLLGRKSEREMEDFFASHGYWALNIPRGPNGQPFDFVACKGGDSENLIKGWFLDVKHIEKEKASFDFNRIEPNQRTSMRYARMFARLPNLGFIIRTERDPQSFLYLSYDKLIELEEKGLKSVKINELERFENLI